MLKDEQTAQAIPISPENGSGRARITDQQTATEEVQSGQDRDTISLMIDVVGETSRACSEAIVYTDMSRNLNFSHEPAGLADLIKSTANYCLSNNESAESATDGICDSRMSLVFHEDDVPATKERIKDVVKDLTEDNKLIKKTVGSLNSLRDDITADEGYDMVVYFAGGDSIRHFEAVDGFMSCVCVSINGQSSLAHGVGEKLKEGKFDSVLAADMINFSLSDKLSPREEKEFREFKKLFDLAMLVSDVDQQRALDRLISPEGIELWSDTAKNQLIIKRREISDRFEQAIFSRNKQLKDKGLLLWKESPLSQEVLMAQTNKFFGRYDSLRGAKKRPKLLKIGRKAVEEAEEPTTEVERPKNVVFMKKRLEGFVEASEDDFVEMFKDKVDKHDKGVEADARVLFESLQQVRNEDGKYEGVKKLSRFDKAFDGEPFYELKPKHAIGASQKSKLVKSVRVILGTEGTDMYVLGIARSDSLDKDIRSIAKGLAAPNGQNNQ